MTKHHVFVPPIEEVPASLAGLRNRYATRNHKRTKADRFLDRVLSFLTLALFLVALWVTVGIVQVVMSPHGNTDVNWVNRGFYGMVNMLTDLLGPDVH